MVIEVSGWGSNEYKQIDANKEGTDVLPYAVPIEVGGGKSQGHDIFESRVSSRPHVFAGGAMSAFLDEGTSLLCVWGQHNVRIDGVHAACLGHAHGLALHSSGYLLSFGEDSHGQCSKAPRHLCRPLSEIAQLSSEGLKEDNGATLRVWKAACGLRHSAAIAADGSLFTWERGKHGQVLIAGGEKRESVFSLLLLAMVPL